MSPATEGKTMSTSPASRISPVVIVALGAALIAATMVVGAGPAYRMQIVELRDAFSLLRWGAWTGLGAGLLALAGLFVVRNRAKKRGFALAVGGAVIGGLAFGIPFAILQGAKAAPPIHDITTDSANPPPFIAVAPLRSSAPNSLEYAGEAIATQQRAAYPYIQPVVLAQPPAEAFRRALDAARDSGWEIVASVPSEGRIEATDTTRWFGFKDDIVVRITPDAGGSRIDVRSVSRVGRSDLGKNAQRVHAYLQRLGH
jgi:uncharacterized protein (DUF1499 family)